MANVLRPIPDKKCTYGTVSPSWFISVSPVYVSRTSKKKKREKIAFALVSTRRAAVSRKDLFSRG